MCFIIDTFIFFQNILPTFMKHTPAGSSFRQFIHFSQLMRGSRFCQYDRGIFENKNKYGSFRPPSYNLKKITAPIALHYGRNDWLAAIVDVQRLKSRLPNVIEFNQVPHPRFNHLDFILAQNIRQLLYDHVIELVNSFSRRRF